MTKKNRLEKKEAEELQRKQKRPFWKSGTFKIGLTIGIIVAIFGGFWQFILPRWFPEKPRPPERKVSPVEFESKGEPLSVIIKHIEGETDYDVISTREVEEFRIYGSFKGNDWVQILKKIINAYDKQLKLDIDEKNKKISIALKQPSELPKK